MVAVKACCAGGTNGVAYVYECRCTRGNWGCTAAYHGGGACGLCTPEGTAEPGTPAVSDAGAGDAG